ncbi:MULTISPECIES: N-acetylglucosamine-6-phosphate deacetylase [Fischerella]|uniref:N-acetylglucosamine-6-phosphate deacetylase n=1 Tax=Fischerella muscicola CCMEE 5323 TaxID=2019572 RepID=A0A2N6JV38_FISMU|nr:MULTISPECIES: N-acetylglucosamine-6-phosphate deacetylase [Fischerella]MBD2432995.1 N-acetylglucosamine-6-phosphate deacetylase [Fischerella sp. FACHB-380]PLZ82443.1 N-acetylglucosamine-6-phosphate deacetylase [Fischerella muscicola CCMEE 5323]
MLHPQSPTPDPFPIDIINARVPGYKDLQMLLVNRQGMIERILPIYTVFKRVPPADLQVLDVKGDWISLGGVDLQINGALGLAFPELQTENAHILPKICEFLWNVGVDAFLPTLVTTGVENIQRSLAVITKFMANGENLHLWRSRILGVHLEGPFLNFHKRGAHPAEYLLPLTIDEVKRVLGDYADIVKVVTLAPELDATGEVIPYLRSLGITVSLGHSQATAAQAQQAFEVGATMVTHAFNAMLPLHHREPGLLGAAITHPEVMCGFIADGQHVSPTMLDILLRASRYEKGLFLVSDALSPLGLPDGIYPWDNRHIEVKAGTARLPDGTLSGTTLPLLVGVQNLVKWGICDVEVAIALATDAPRKAIGLSESIVGASASQLLRWHLDESSRELTWQRLVTGN